MTLEDKDRVGATRETRGKGRSCLFPHATFGGGQQCRWRVTLKKAGVLGPAPACYPSLPAKDPLAGRLQRHAGLRHGPNRAQRASPFQLKLLLIHRGLGRRVGARPGVGQGFPDSYLQQPGPRAITSATPAHTQGPARPAPHLLSLCARLEQALLDGELQQVIILIAEGLTALRAQHAVPLGHLEHSGVHLTWERAPWDGRRANLSPQVPETNRPCGPLPPAVVPEVSTAEPGAGTHTELRGSSQPHRLLKVMRALSTWKRGISEETAQPELLQPETHPRLAPATA